MYEKMAESDSTIDLAEKFKLPEVGKKKGGRPKKGKGRRRRVIDDIKTYLDIEDQFKCSGMCRKSLFYFGRNITENAYPEETCLHHARKYMMENGVPYTTCCVLLSITGLWMFMVSFCMCRKQQGGQEDAHRREDLYEGDFDKVAEPHFPPIYTGDMQGDGTRLGGQESGEGKTPA